MEFDNYWGVTTIDVDKAGWSVDAHYAHLLWFQYLRFSPSYALAKKARTKGLTAQDKRNLPADFAKVLATYDLLGDVHNTVFRLWWQRNGYEVFGVPYEMPITQAIAVIDGNIKPKKTDLDLFDKFLSEAHEHPNFGKSLVLSIPLDQPLKASLSQVKAFLQANQVVKESAPKKIKPKLSLQGQRFNSHALVKGFGLLMFKAAFPQFEHWRLGVVTKLSDSYSPALDHMAPRTAKDAIEAGDRILMGKITYRALDKYQKIAENAARGKFPCSDPVAMAPFDWQALNTQYDKTTKWEEKALTKVLARQKRSK
jgi:hypothetical protein